MYSMFTEEGNVVVGVFVAEVSFAIEAGTIKTPEDIYTFVCEGMYDIADNKDYEEVFDTAVRESIWADVFKASERIGIYYNDFAVLF